jgi:hypothetical protein
MRPLKYKNLGEMSIVRVPQIALGILPQLCALMQQIEENGEDSTEVISTVLNEVIEKLQEVE